MKVLVTGATGLVGKAIVKILNEKGIAVNYLSTNKRKIVSKENFKGFYWNPSKGEIDPSCFKEVSAVINLAGSSIAKRWSVRNKKKIIGSRVDSLQTLYSAMQKIDASAIDTFVSASAIGIYPNSLSNFYSEETTDVDKSFLGEVVEKWEEKMDAFQDFRCNVSKIRIGIVLSDLDGALPKMARPIRNFVGAIFGSGKQWQSWIHIDDLAQMFVFTIENSLEGTFNGVAPNPVTHAKMTKELARVLERPLILPNIPKFVMQMLLGQMAYLLFASQRVSSKSIEKKGFQFYYPNIGPALEEIYLPKSGNGASKIKSLDEKFV
ncbi:TIGR01777 family oxidoreductase [Flagellimonas sp. S3867]|uniref:TIGR01777 family oxidoreductase n=1 Tax=Flagellimonas sp. S3867 TaxID=2768063 RepID=UPI001689D4B7|nr:TIGR01777 family oxidoreductase [Flagellimonas sp. S3867]